MSDNPCIHKKVCKTCAFAEVGSRPEMCKSLACKDYTPCKRCGDNKRLDTAGHCARCDGKGESVVVRDADGNRQVIESPSPTHPAVANHSPVQGEISFPGDPPSHYSISEKNYYRRNWESYSGYYRDPTVWAIVHNIILIEIELMHCISMLAQDRSATNKEIEQRHERLSKNMVSLRNALPEKESLELNEDEKALGSIYERYIEETKATRISGVSRVLTPEAIALAPVLDFPVNPAEILSRLGYKLVDANTAIDKHFRREEVPEEPEKLLEFLGFFLREKLALADNISSSRPQKDEYEDDELEDMSGRIDEILLEESEQTARRENKKQKDDGREDDRPGFSFSGEFA